MESVLCIPPCPTFRPIHTQLPEEMVLRFDHPAECRRQFNIRNGRDDQTLRLAIRDQPRRHRTEVWIGVCDIDKQTCIDDPRHYRSPSRSSAIHSAVGRPFSPRKRAAKPIIALISLRFVFLRGIRTRHSRSEIFSQSSGCPALSPSAFRMTAGIETCPRSVTTVVCLSTTASNHVNPSCQSRKVLPKAQYMPPPLVSSAEKRGQENILA